MSNFKVKDNTFWVLIGDEMTLFIDRSNAIKTLTSLKNPSEAQLIAFTREESDRWTIEQVSWKDIATDLIRAMKNGF